MFGRCTPCAVDVVRPTPHGQGRERILSTLLLQDEFSISPRSNRARHHLSAHPAGNLTTPARTRSGRNPSCRTNSWSLRRKSLATSTQDEFLPGPAGPALFARYRNRIAIDCPQSQTPEVGTLQVKALRGCARFAILIAARHELDRSAITARSVPQARTLRLG